MTIIFSFTKQEALWAVAYAKAHPQDIVKVMAPTIPAQLVLRRHGLPYLDYFSPALYRENNYPDYSSRLTRDAHKVTSYLKTHFPKKLDIFGTPLIDILILLVEGEFLVTLSAYELFRAIEEKWKPTTCYIPSSSNISASTGATDSNFAVASLIRCFFAEKRKIKTYTVAREPTLRIALRRTVSLVWPIKDFFIRVLVIVHRIAQHLKPVMFFRQPQADILWYSFGYNLSYYKTLFSLLRRRGSPYSYRVITGNQDMLAEWQVIRDGIPFTPAMTFLSRKLSDKIREQQDVTQHLINKTVNSNLSKLFPRTLPEPLKSALALKTKLILKSYGLKFLMHSALAKEAIERIRPAIVITTHDPSPSATPFVSLARSKHVRTLLLLHGVIENLPFGAWYQSSDIAIFGKWTKDLPIWKMHRKNNPPRLYDIGFAHLDPSFNYVARNTQTISSDKRKNQPLYLTLLLCQYLPDTFRMSKFLDELFREIARISWIARTTVRLHRDQSSSGIPDLAKYYNLSLVINNLDPLDVIMAKSDIVLSWDTTALLWPVIHQKPLFHTTPWWGKGTIPTYEFHASWCPKDANDFAYQLQILRKNPRIVQELLPGQRLFLQQYVGATDSMSTEKLFSLIRNLTRNEARNNKHNVKGVVVENDLPEDCESA